VPLAVKGRIIGGLGIAHAKRNYFTAHQAALALSMADQVAITMVNAELYEHAQALAALQERQRLAQNLHDAVNQSLFSAGIIAEVLPRLWERDQELARQSLEDLRRLTRGAMAEMRALLAELRPSTLTDADLGELLGLLGNAFTGRTNVPVKISIVGEGALPADVQVALYRVCQETLNNVAKHAGASNVEIQVKQDANAIEMSIRDDGRGFVPGPSTSGHYGLGMMQERAEAVGAQLSITSHPGHGTELKIRWAQNPSKEPL
jgi:two-component system nitrate/nitrite sensor histidine kinase NarX